jgi:hypothetical protein
MPDELDDLLSNVPAAPKVARAAAPSGSFDLERDAPTIKEAFRAQFGHDLPVSAYGQTEFHRRLGRDHSANLDVALSPNSEAGKWLTGYLAQNNIPFIPMYHAGQMASGPHIHVGLQSRKLDALDSVLDQVPAAASSPDPAVASSPAPAGDELDKLMAGVPAADPDLVAVVNSAHATTPTVAAPKPQTFDPYTSEGRAARDAQAQAESTPNAMREIAVTLPQEYSKLSPRDVGELAVKQYARSEGISGDFAASWLAQHPEVGLYAVHDAGGQPAPFYLSPAFDSETRTLKVGAQMPQLSQLKREYEASRNLPERGADWLLDDSRAAGEKALDVASAAGHGLDIVTRPLQAASVGVAGTQRAAGSMLAAPFSQSARDVLKSGLYEPDMEAAAMLHKLTTGETPAGYDSPIGEGADLLSQKYTRKPLPGLVRTALDVGGDPLSYLGGEAVNEAAAPVAARIASYASRIAEDLPGSRFISRASRALTDLHDPRVEELFDSGGRVLDLRETPKDADHFFVTIKAGDGSMVRVDTRDGSYTELGDAPHHSNFQSRATDGTFTPDGSAPAGDELDQLLSDVPPAPASSILSRAAQTASDVINLPKSIKSSFALHGPFRQGVFQAAAHPTFLKDAIETQAKAFASESAFQDFARGLMERPDFADLKEFLFLPSVRDVEYAGHAPAAMREERFASAMADKIPGVRRSSRAYMAAMDSLRVQAWDQYVADLAGNPAVTRDTYKALGELVNITTGRGVVPVLDRSAMGKKIVTLLNNPLWSPRAMASRFNMLSPYRLIENSVNPATRPVALLQLRDSTRALATVGTTMALLSQVPGVKVGLNPYKPDWGKVVIGNTRYDLIDGVPATARYVAQMSRAFYDQAAGKKAPAWQEPAELTKDFLRRRLSPTAAVAANAYTGKTLEGQPFTYSGAARDLALPFVVDGLYQGWLDAGGSGVGDVVTGKPVKTAFKGAAHGLPSVIGIPASTYKSRVPQRFQTSVPQRRDIQSVESREP